MSARDRNRRGRGLGPFTQKSTALGPNDPRYRRQSQAGGTQIYVHEPLYIEDGVLKIDLDSSTQEVMGGQLKQKSGTIVPAAHAESHEAGGDDVVSHQDLSGSGSNTHAMIDAHMALLTTKGDILARSTVPARFPVGTNRMLVEADSTQTFGIKWAFRTFQSVGTSATNYAVVAGDEFIVADTSGGNVTIDLPALSGAAGRMLVVIRPSAANVLTLDGSGAETINAAATFVVPTTAHIWTFLFATASGWYAHN